MGRLEDRVAKLEPRIEKSGAASWSLEQQIDDISHKIARFARPAWRPARYVATDREIALLCLLTHHEDLARGGMVKLAWGASVGLRKSGTLVVRGIPSVSDLPEEIQQLVERMPRRWQARREAELPGLYVPGGGSGANDD